MAVNSLEAIAERLHEFDATYLAPFGDEPIETLDPVALAELRSMLKVAGYKTANKGLSRDGIEMSPAIPMDHYRYSGERYDSFFEYNLKELSPGFSHTSLEFGSHLQEYNQLIATAKKPMPKPIHNTLAGTVAGLGLGTVYDLAAVHQSSPEQVTTLTLVGVPAVLGCIAALVGFIKGKADLTNAEEEIRSLQNLFTNYTTTGRQAIFNAFGVPLPEQYRMK